MKRKSKFEQIRQQRKVHAYQRKIVAYRGHGYRISSVTSTGALILRDEAIVHPTDPDLDYYPSFNRPMGNEQMMNKLKEMSHIISGRWGDTYRGEDPELDRLFDLLDDVLNTPTKDRCDYGEV